jgi:hypothetical protein
MIFHHRFIISMPINAAIHNKISQNLNLQLTSLIHLSYPNQNALYLYVKKLKGTVFGQF